MAPLAEAAVGQTVPVEPAVEGKAKVRLDFIDGLRGLACLYVVMYHLFLLWPVASHSQSNTGLRFLGLLTRFAAYGHVGVDVFLALSGFVLFYPLCLRSSAGSRSLPPLELGRYARRRTRRILPPYLAALLIFSILPFWSDWAANSYPRPTVVQFVAHLLLVHNVFPSTVLTIDGPLWSLALEAQLYLLFPYLVILFRRVGPVRFGAVVFAGSLGFRLVAWYLLSGRSLSLDGQFALMDSLPGRFFEFAAGMVAAYVLTRPSVVSLQNWLRVSATAAILGGAGLGYAADKHFGEHSPFPALLWGIAAFGLIVGATPSGLAPLRVFSSHWVVQLGLISYSIYLIHEPLLQFTGAFVRQAGVTPLLALGGFVFLVGPALLGLCGLFHLAFERPFMQPASSNRRILGGFAERLAQGAKS